MELLIEDDWYATPDSQQILFALKKISDNQDKYFTMISQMNDKIDDLSKKIDLNDRISELSKYFIISLFFTTFKISGSITYTTPFATYN